MSVRTMARVWQDSKHGGTELLMLLAIADFADDDGNAYPAVGTLAKKCRMGCRNANYVLKALEDSGELKVMRGRGPRGTNRYRLLAKGVQSFAPLQQPAPLQPVAPLRTIDPCSPLQEGGATGFPLPLQPIADKPSGTTKEPSKGRTASAASSRRASKHEKLLSEFLKECQAADVMVIPGDDPIYTYAEKVGIHADMLAACWRKFRDYYATGNGSDKRQKDWRAHYRSAIRGNWYKFWYMPDGQPAAWTTAGEQERRDMAMQADGTGGTP